MPHLPVQCALLAVSAMACGALGLLPGMNAVRYKDGDRVELKANKLTSVRTQLPYDFYDALPFCRPRVVLDKKETLGEVISGDRIANSLYDLFLFKEERCRALGEGAQIGHTAKVAPGTPYPSNCTATYSPLQLERFVHFIKHQYRVHWLLDNMNVVQPRSSSAPAGGGGQGDPEFLHGFALGSRDREGFYLNNHVSITVRYHREDPVEPYYHVVGFEVVPHSVDYSVLKSATECEGPGVKPLVVGPKAARDVTVVWSYSVAWKEDTETTWAKRYDRYMTDTDGRVHWFSIVNSLMILLFLSGMVAMILLRTLHADLKLYASQVESREDVEETGWKLVHGDVFRTPRHPSVLSSLVGFGAQLCVCVVFLFLYGVLGFLNPANRGGLLTAVVTLVLLSGTVSGFLSTRLYLTFRLPGWKRNAALTAFLVPGIIFGIFLFINFFIWGARSSGGVDFGTLVMIVFLWLSVALPLILAGSWLARQRPCAESSARISQIPRQIPTQVWYMKPAFSVLMSGLLPFGAVFIELYFVMGSVWGHQLGRIIGFLFVVFVILSVTCAEISVVMTYFQLCGEDYHWWWRSFLASGSSALYFFLYSCFYFAVKLEISRLDSALLYFGYSFIFALSFFALTGFIGFSSSFLFTRKLYGSLPFD